MTNIDKHVQAAKELHRRICDLMDNLPDDLSFPERKIPPNPIQRQIQYPCDVKINGDYFIPVLYSDPNDVSLRSSMYFIRDGAKENKNQKQKIVEKEIDYSLGEPRESKVLSHERWDAFRRRTNRNKNEETNFQQDNYALQYQKSKEEEMRREEELMLNSIVENAKGKSLYTPMFAVIDEAFIKRNNC